MARVAPLRARGFAPKLVSQPRSGFASNFERNSKGLINYYINSQIPFPANSNQYRFNNEFLSNQKL